MAQIEHRMQALVETLCSPSFLPRNPGTDGGAAARDLLRSRLEELDLSPVGEKGFDQAIPVIGGTNLLGMVPGRGDRYVLLAAHYDACMHPNPGADDNAAAVAVTLEVARRLKDADPFRSVVIALFDAEEPPYFLGPEMGSQWFVDHPTIPLDRVDMMVCLDLVGHALGPEGTPQAVRDSVFVLGAEKSTGTPELFDELSAVAGIEPRRVDNYIIDPMSDYYAFMRADIPFLFYSCGRSEHYHAETDTPEKLDYAKMAAFTDHLTGVMLALANRTDKPVYLSDGVDDDATVRSLEQVLGAFAEVNAAAQMASAVVTELRSKVDSQGALSEEDRSAIRFLVGELERALE